MKYIILNLFGRIIYPPYKKPPPPHFPQKKGKKGKGILIFFEYRFRQIQESKASSCIPQEYIYKLISGKRFRFWRERLILRPISEKIWGVFCRSIF